MNDTVDDRTPEQPVDVHALGRQLLEEARGSGGSSAVTLNPGGAATHQTVVALTAETALDPEHWNGPATVLVLDGQVDLGADGMAVTTGYWASLPDAHSAVVAIEDTCLLLVVDPTG